MDVRFKTPANFYICGQTQAGKSHFTRRMLRHLEELFYPVPTKIIYCYGEYQKKFDELPPNVELMEGFPDNLSDMVRGHDSSLVVLDDLMSQCSNDQRVADLFTRGSHHRGISVLAVHGVYVCAYLQKLFTRLKFETIILRYRAIICDTERTINIIQWRLKQTSYAWLGREITNR